MARNVVITGAASGIGKATAALAEAHGWQPIRADLNEGDVKADLATPQGRAAFVDGVTALVGDRLDAVIVCAGVALPTPLTVKVNYFGAVATLEGLRPLLAQGTLPRAVGISSFASIMQADSELVEACLSGGILLNGIAPGMVVTPMTQAMVDDKTVRAQLEHAMPMPIGRDARPEEIAELLLWRTPPLDILPYTARCTRKVLHTE